MLGPTPQLSPVSRSESPWPHRSRSTIPEFVGALENAWEYFGGVAKRVVIDNPKAAVTKADRYESIFQRTFEAYAAHRGFVIDAAVVRHPKGKPKV